MVSGFFTKKITQVQTIGDILEQRRMSLGIALERAAQETAIQQYYLQALEKNDRASLPAEIYVLGFVRTYARYLRLNETKVVEQWKRERDIAKHMSNPDKVLGKTFIQRKSILPRIKFSPLIVRSGLIGLAVIAGLLYIGLAVSSLGKAPELSLTEPTSDREVDDSSIVIVGETRPEAQLTINEQPVQVSSEGKFRETLNLQAGLNQIRIVAESKLGRKTEIVRNIQANLEPIASKNEEKAGQISNNDLENRLIDVEEDSQGPVDLTVKINDEATWISVNVDGQAAFEGTLLPNSNKRFIGDREVVLTSGKAQHTAVRFKGKELTSLGEGYLREVVFTPDLDLKDLSTTASAN